MNKRGYILFWSYLIIIAMSFALIPTFHLPNAYAETNPAPAATTATEPDFIVPVTQLTEVPAGYIGIYTKDDFDRVRYNLSGQYILMNDIEYSAEDFMAGGAYYNNGLGWEPIGTPDAEVFSGIFDGNGYRISGITQNLGTDYAIGGVFGKVSGGEITNLTISNSINISDTLWGMRVGNLAGSVVNGEIINCHNTGNIFIDDPIGNGSDTVVGGIVGSAYDSMIALCSNAGKINCMTIQATSVGGIIGEYYVSIGQGIIIDRCSNTGDIYANTSGRGLQLGGICGVSLGLIDNSYNLGDLNGNARNGTAYVGGLSGNCAQECIYRSYNLGRLSISGGRAYLGGIVGSGRTANNCFYIDSCASGTSSIGWDSAVMLTRNQMTQQESFVGFDFNEVWMMDLNLQRPVVRGLPLFLSSQLLFEPATYYVSVGGTTDVMCKVKPEYAEYELMYKSSNTGKATVDFEGSVSGISTGLTYITVTDAYTGLSAVCQVQVVQGVTTLLISGADSVEYGNQIQLSATTLPSTAYDSTVIWETSDPTIATVDQNGVVTGIKGGQATIYASAKIGTPNTQRVPYTISVIRHPESISLNTQSTSILTGKSCQLIATLLPVDTSNKNVNWFSSDPSIASVTSDGTIIGWLPGEVVITAICQDDNTKVAQCTVTVIRPVDSVLITSNGHPLSEYSLQTGDATLFGAMIFPGDASNKAVTWLSSNTSIVTVSALGLVTAVSPGMAVITVKSVDGNKTDTCVVMVQSTLTQSIDFTIPELYVGDTVAAETTVLPMGSPAPTWESSNTDIATVDKFGNVTGVSAGSVLITATASDKSGITSSKTIKVFDDFYVTYHLNGGTGLTEDIYTWGMETSLQAPTRNGYIFAGWYDNSALTGTLVTNPSASTPGDREYWAKWTLINYTISYYLNGGINNGLNPTTYTVEAQGITLSQPTRTGYTFAGWYSNSGFTGSIVTTIPAGSTGDVSLYAKWTINRYTVTFNSQGGSTVGSVSTDYNTSITAPTAPTRTGYTFAGWYKEPACTNAWSFTTDKVTADTTLYAKWTINQYTVTFNSQGGSTVGSVSTDYNTSITAPTAPTRTGYSFGGWYKEPGCTNAWTFATDKVTANVTLYAKWTPISYTISYYLNGGINNGLNPTTYTIEAQGITLSQPTRMGYTFAGWFGNSGFTGSAVTTIPAGSTGDVSLYAKWNINQYTVTFNSQGGSTVGSVSTDYNTMINAPTAPSMTGYVFDGWYKESSCTNSWAFASDKVAGDTTLFAKWTPNTYTIAFNGNDATSGTMTNLAMTYDTPKALTSNGFTKTGYTFAGWATSASGPVVYANQHDVTNLTATEGETITLYAKWIPNNYSVKFSGNGSTSGTMSSLGMTYDTTKALPVNAFKKTGYSFLGWATSATGSVVYKDLASVKNLTATNGAAITLYAKWGAPIALATSYNYNSIKVSWAYAGSATSYKIYRATSATGTYALVYTASSTARYWVNTSLVTGKTYYYKVYPVAGGKAYAHSTYKYAKSIPTTPTVTLSKASATSIKVTWTGVSGATKYQVYRATSATGTFTLVYTASSTLRAWTNSGLSAGTTYYYKVRAYHLEGSTNVYGAYSSLKYL